MAMWTAKKEITQFRSKYIIHRYDAERRSIEFFLTFEEWMKIWLDSGCWPKRGPGKGQYVMSRPNDIGPYAVGNVKIVTSEHNKKENKKSADFLRNLAKLHPESIEKARQTNTGRKASKEAVKNMAASQRKRREREACQGLLEV